MKMNLRDSDGPWTRPGVALMYWMRGRSPVLGQWKPDPSKVHLATVSKALDADDDLALVFWVLGTQKILKRMTDGCHLCEGHIVRMHFCRGLQLEDQGVVWG